MNLGPLFSVQVQTNKAVKSRVKKVTERHLSAADPWLVGWHWRILPALCCLTAGLIILAGRLWQLQIIQGQEHRQASLANSYALQVVPAPRGLIYDANGVVLARNEPTFRVAVTTSLLPTNAPDRQSEINRLAASLKMTNQEIEQQLKLAADAPFFPVTIKSNIDRDTEISLLSIKDQLPGVSIDQDLRRSYPLGPGFSHLLGYTGNLSQQDQKNPAFNRLHPGETVGKAGLELQYETDLHGQIGQKLSQVNAQGLPQSGQSEIDPQSGRNLVLAIDSKLQQQTYQALIDASQKYLSVGAAAVFQDPRTGKVLSLVSVPSFDNNLFAKGISATDYASLLAQAGNPLFDRSIAGTYPPGSVVKPLVAAAAINEHVITPTTIVNSPSFITVGSFRYADWTFWEGRAAPGPINVIQAIAQSCDTFFYQIGGGYQQQAGLGIDELHQYYDQAGFGSQTGIDLPGEMAGTSPDPAWKKQKFPTDPNWYIGNTYQLAIGQSYLLATPLQVNNLTSAIANGGTLYKPQLVDKITSDSGSLVKQYPAQAIRNSIAALPGLKIAQQGMREAVAHGIIYPLRNNPITVSAKTGTAEFGTPNSKGQYETHAWVTGFFPSDHPQVSFTVLLESGGSSSNAAEVANSIIQWYADQHPELKADKK